MCKISYYTCMDDHAYTHDLHGYSNYYSPHVLKVVSILIAQLYSTWI